MDNKDSEELNNFRKEKKSRNEYYRNYYANNKEKHKLATKAWYKKHPEKMREYSKRHRELHRDKISARRKLEYQDNHNGIRDKQKQYYLDNREHILTQKKQWYQDNKKTKKESEKTSKPDLDPEPEVYHECDVCDKLFHFPDGKFDGEQLICESCSKEYDVNLTRRKL